MNATYRLQLTPEFGFAQARELVPYLRELGVSHLYLSPVMQARTGSQHGYDVVDPTRVSEQLGGEDELRKLCAAGLRVIVDIVPNHMATSDENPFWSDEELRKTFFDLDLRTGMHRRFFDIGELAGVRQEDEAVFATTHAKILELVDKGLVDGVRIDHVDGLANPREYLDRLARAGVERVWVEKIVEGGEHLRDWPVQGTTGYEFANDSTALFVDPAAEEPFTDEERTFAELAFEAKLEVATTLFEPELRRLNEELAVDAPNLALALASFHVYRTYVEPGAGVVADEDRAEIARAAIAESLTRILTLDEPGHDAFVTRFQQTTGPVIAKGVEDTAFYRYLRLTALNEVGGDPGRWSLPVDAFHRSNIERELRFPNHLLATQTHDTKRSGDVRARIVALTWLRDEWLELIARWPSTAESNFVYQTMVGAWPLERERLDAYLEKALREAKVHTSWIEPNEEYEAGVRAFVAERYADANWLAELESFVRDLSDVALRIVWGMTLLKLTVPGVPDIYQGDEIESLSLVDPDNRRPVDWELRRRLLADRSDPKLELIRRVLAVREGFAGYMPIEAGDDVCAFRRGPRFLVVVPVRAGASKAIPEADGLDDLLREYPVGLFVDSR